MIHNNYIINYNYNFIILIIFHSLDGITSKQFINTSSVLNIVHRLPVDSPNWFRASPFGLTH